MMSGQYCTCPAQELLTAPPLLLAQVPLSHAQHTQPMRPGRSSQKYLQSKEPKRGLSSRPKKKS